MLPTWSMSVVRKHFWQEVRRPCGRVLLAEEVRLEGLHAGRRQQHRRVVGGRHQRARAHRAYGRCARRTTGRCRGSRLRCAGRASAEVYVSPCPVRRAPPPGARRRLDHAVADDPLLGVEQAGDLAGRNAVDVARPAPARAPSCSPAASSPIDRAVDRVGAVAQLDRGDALGVPVERWPARPHPPRRQRRRAGRRRRGCGRRRCRLRRAAARWRCRDRDAGRPCSRCDRRDCRRPPRRDRRSRRGADARCRDGPGSSARSVPAMKQRSWLSGLEATGSPASAASARTCGLGQAPRAETRCGRAVPGSSAASM